MKYQIQVFDCTNRDNRYEFTQDGKLIAFSTFVCMGDGSEEEKRVQREQGTEFLKVVQDGLQHSLVHQYRWEIVPEGTEDYIEVSR